MKKIKIISFIMILIILISNFNITYAMGDEINEGNASEYIKEETEKFQSGLNNPLDNPDSWKPVSQGDYGDVQDIKQKTGVILGIVNIVGVVVSVIALVAVGIKYMLGSVEEKAEYKSTMILYLIGAAMLFTATTIPNIIYNFASNI